jgi:GDP-L-fucose synthase
MLNYDSDEIINVGTGEDLTIAALAELIGKVVGYPGRITFDASKPDGTPRKLLDVSRLHAAGWRARITLEEGIRRTYEWYLAQSADKASAMLRQ